MKNIEPTNSKTNAQTCCDTLVGDTVRHFRHSADTLVGQSCTTLTHSDVIWPHKLTVLRPQLPEAASRTTFVLQSYQFYSSQKLLAALHLFILPSGQF